MVKIGLRELMSSSSSSLLPDFRTGRNATGCTLFGQPLLSSFRVRVNLISPYNLPRSANLTDLQASPRLKCLSDTQKEHQLDGPRTGYQNKEEEKVSIKARGTICATGGSEPGKPDASAYGDQEAARSDNRRRGDDGRK